MSTFGFLRRAAWGCALVCVLLFSPCARALDVNGVNVTLDFGDSTFANGSDPIVAWIRRSMEIVAGYYGQFPVRELRIRVQAAGGHGVKTGTALGTRGGMIRVVVGREATEAELLNDWVLVHEMIHLALPEVDQQQMWLSEGLATYVEGIARAQAGNRTPADVWAEQMRSMPKGLPQPSDAGLDHTHTWGRTYWGGALFCLMADIEIRRQSHNKFGLQDALRAVARASGGLGTEWPVSRIFATGDAAVGTRVLEDMYGQWKDEPVRPDLAALWRSLGVEREGNTVLLKADAPLADIRRTIMRR